MHLAKSRLRNPVCMAVERSFARGTRTTLHRPDVVHRVGHRSSRRPGVAEHGYHAKKQVQFVVQVDSLYSTPQLGPRFKNMGEYGPRTSIKACFNKAVAARGFDSTTRHFFRRVSRSAGVASLCRNIRDVLRCYTRNEGRARATLPVVAVSLNSSPAKAMVLYVKIIKP
jgi:hypothetical protein